VLRLAVVSHRSPTRFTRTNTPSRRSRRWWPAADDYGTYVMAHVFNTEGIARALNAGVKSIEHAFLTEEDSMRLLVAKGAILSIQFLVMGPRGDPRPKAGGENETSQGGSENLVRRCNALLGFAPIAVTSSSPRG